MYGPACPVKLVDLKCRGEQVKVFTCNAVFVLARVESMRPSSSPLCAPSLTWCTGMS
jgi:hypothetical protein